MRRLLTIGVTFLLFSFIFVATSTAEGNLLQNPGFEELGWPPAYWSEWEGSSSGSSSDGVAGYISDTVSHTGSQSTVRELYGRRSRWGGYTQDINASPGDPVTASGWLMSSSSDNPLKYGAEAYIELKFLDGSDNELAVYKSDALTGASSWIQHSIAQEAPAGTAKARFSFVLYTERSYARGKVYFDDAAVEVEGADTTPPIVTITSPEDQSTTETSPITVTGTVDDPTVATIDVNGNIEPVSSGSWSSSVSLIEGSNIITATATDDSANEGSDSITVYYELLDTTSPVVTIISPPDGTRTNSYPIEVTGTVDDPQVTSIDVNGAIEPVSNGSWSSYVSLAEGSNTITATAQDPSGNVGADSITVYLDTIAPVVTITSPQDQTTTEVSPITVSGTVDDLTVTSIDVNGNIEPVSSGSWSSIVSLIEGSNIITATATDDAGNAGSDSITVHLILPNLLLNPGFEDSAWPPVNWSEWQGAGSGDPADGSYGYIETTIVRSGSQSVARGLYGTGIRWGGYSQDVVIGAWDLVKASCWLMSSSSDEPLASGAEAYIEIKFFDASNEELGLYKSTPLTAASPWIEHTLEKGAPSNAAKAQLNLVIVGNADNATGKVYFDDAQIEIIPGGATPDPKVPFNKPQSTGSVKISGNTLLVDGTPFTIKGVCYQPTPIGTVPWQYDIFGDSGIYNRDLPILRGMGANTLRTYAKVTSTAFLDACYNGGVNPVYVVMGFYIDGSSDLSDPVVRNSIKTDFQNYVSTFKNHPAVLMWSPGNETEWAYKGCDYEYYTLINELAEVAYIEEGSAYHPVTAVLMDIDDIGDSNLLATDDDMDYLDVWGANVYKGLTFGTLFDDYASRSSKTFWIPEFGTDAWHTNDKFGDPSNGYLDEVSQEQLDVALWDEIAARGDVCSGGTIFAYSDEWWKDSSGSNSSHDYGGFPYTYTMINHPDEYSNEEWYGVVAVSDNGTGPDIVTTRAAYDGLKSRWYEAPTLPTIEVFSDSFENGEWNGLWTEDSQRDWYDSTQRKVDGSYSAEVDGSASDATLTSVSIDLQGRTSVNISFWWYIESGLDSGEYLAFDVDTGSGWVEKARLRGNVDLENTWQNVSIDLTSINSLRIRFRGKMSSSREDANVDMVEVIAW